MSTVVRTGAANPRLGDLATLPDFAEAAGVEAVTIEAYRSRGYLPEPVGMIGRVPVWTTKQVRDWQASRPGRGRRRGAVGPPA